MKTKTAALFASLLCLTVSANAQLTVLLGGFDGKNAVTAPIQSTIAANDGVDVQLTLGAGVNTYGWTGGGSSNDKWGTQTFIPLPSTGTAETTGYIDASSGTYTFTITAGTSPVTLESIHWVAKRDNSNSLTNVSVSFVSSTDVDLTAGTGISATGLMTNIGGFIGYDLDLADVFAGTNVLSAGETVVISWTGTGVGGRTRMDNFAVAGFVDTGDTTPPDPSTMTWFSLPTAIGESSITMTATTATDPSGVLYQFVRRLGLGGSVEFTSAWQSSPEFTDTGLTPSTEYSYTVTARDLLANTGTASSEEAATTFIKDVIPPSPDPITFSLAPTAVSPTAIAMTATTATDTHGVEYRFVQTPTAPGGTSSSWQDSPTYIDNGLTANTEYTYRVECRDKSSDQNPTTGTTTATATTHPATGIGTILVGGYDGTNESSSALQSATISNVPVTFTSSTGDITQGNYTTTALWGTSPLDVAATVSSGPIFQSGTNTPITLTMTITNNESVDLPLVGLHFIIKKDVNDQGPKEFTVAYTSGDLGSPASIDVGLPNGANNTYDIPLASFLADTTLAPGETATFTWTSGTPQNPLGNTSLRLDNFALSGEAIAAGSPFDTWAATGTLGTVTFDGDLNGDGVQDGAAFLLGAADPDVDATGLLPTISESGGDLVMAFDCLATAERGAAVLNLEYDADLAGTWLSVPVPGATALDPIVETTATGSVSFVATDGGTNANGDALIDIVATISDATESAAGKLFGRLNGTK